MTFLTPVFLLGLLAVALPIALHLLRRRVTRTVPFPALRFLAPTRADQRHQKIRRRVVLALRCLALAALAAAFARPFLGAPPAEHARATVVVIDNSLSLRHPERWPVLHRQVRAALGAFAPGDTLGLLAMNPRPTWLVAPTRDTDAALVAYDALRPGWQSTRAEPAVRLAADVLAAAPARERRIVFLGDHQALGWAGADFAKKLPAGVELVFPSAPLPAPARQAAVVSASVRREGDSLVALARVQNFSTAKQERRLSVHAENSPVALDSIPVILAAGESATLRIPLPATAPATGEAAPDAPPQPGPAYMRLALDPDEFPDDDAAWAVAPAARGGDRLLILDRAPPPASVSEADYVGTAYAALAALPPALRVAPPPSVAWPVSAAAVLRADASFAGESAARLDAFLSAGGSALVFMDGGPAQRAWLARHGVTPAPLSAASATSPARLRDWTIDHSVVAPLAEANLRSLVGWEFARAWSLPADRVEPLALWADGAPALGEVKIGSGRLLLAGFSPDRRDGDWPVQPAFVPFLHRAATYLLGLAATTAETPLRVGDSLPPGSAEGVWRLVAGPAEELRLAAPVATAAVAAPGVYEHTSPSAPRRLYAVGFDPAESDLAPWPDGAPWQNLVAVEAAPSSSDPAAALRQAAAAEVERQNPLWWWAFAALALFALSELALANRTAR